MSTKCPLSFLRKYNLRLPDDMKYCMKMLKSEIDHYLSENIKEITLIPFQTLLGMYSNIHTKSIFNIYKKS